MTVTTEWMPNDQLPLAERWILDGLTFGDRDDTGCEYYVTNVTGWKGAPTPRTNRQPIVSAHGAYSSPQWRDGRAITLEGRVAAPSETARELAERKLAALCDDPTTVYTLTCTEALGNVRAEVVLNGETLVDISRGRLHLDFSIALFAPDPRRYLDPTPRSIRPPTPATGLNWQSGTGAVTRTNLATNTIGIGTPAWTPYNANSASSVEMYNTLIPGVDTRTFLARARATTAGVIGSNQPVVGVVAGQYYTASVYVRHTAARTATLTLTWTNAGSTIGTVSSAGTALTANAWTRIQFTALAPAGADGLIVSPNVASATVGELLDATALLVERTSSGATAGTFFDGSGSSGYWSAGPYSSTSTDSPVGLDWSTGGGLDWGTPGERGAEDLTNAGTAETWPVYRLDGPTDPLDPPLAQPVISLSTGEQLAYAGTLGQGEYLLIDPHPLRRSVLLNGISRRRSLIQNPQWAPLYPGVTTVALTASSNSPSSRLTVTWSSALA